jgi:hypothetical protein
MKRRRQRFQDDSATLQDGGGPRLEHWVHRFRRPGATAMSASTLVLRDGRVATLRPVQPDDAERMQAFVQGSSATSRRNRSYFVFNNAGPALFILTSRRSFWWS